MIPGAVGRAIGFAMPGAVGLAIDSATRFARLEPGLPLPCAVRKIAAAWRLARL